MTRVSNMFYTVYRTLLFFDGHAKSQFWDDIGLEDSGNGRPSPCRHNLPFVSF